MKYLIKNACVITVNASNDIHDPGFVLIDEQHIVSTGPMSALPDGPFDREIDAQGAFVTPGFINLHQHVYMNLQKGLADGLRLEAWSRGLQRPTRNAMSPDDFLASHRLGALEMLRTGTTTMYNHSTMEDCPDRDFDVAELYKGIGLRQIPSLEFQIRTPGMPDHPFGPEEAKDDIRRKLEQLEDREGDMVRCALTVECNAHHTEAGRSSDELVLAGHAIARECGLRIASHMSGGTLSLDVGFTMYKRRTKRSDVEYLEGLGVLDENWLLIHGIHFSDSDISTVAQRGAAVVYTPTSESMRGGGIGPWVAMRDAGITCALGTDGPAVDYSVDMLEQMKAVCLFQGLRHRRSDAYSSVQALRMGTIDGARALGLDDRLGSIVSGKRADLTMLSRNRPSQKLARDPIDGLVMSTHGADTRLVMVNGSPVYEEGAYRTGLDADAIIAAAHDCAERIHNETGFIKRAQPNWPRA